MKDFIFRKSINEDYDELNNLFKITFGDIAINGGALENIKDRYIIAIKDGIIVSCTGILPLERSDYNGYEVTWTATLPEFRGLGLIRHMLNLEESKLPKDEIPLYCDCWHLKNKENANLHNALTLIGFEKCIEFRIKRCYPHSFECRGCLFREDNCYCYGDLYIKYRKNEKDT